MKKICIALDYNPSSEKVAQTGYAYAKALGAQTTLVHVIENAAYYAMNYSPFMGYDSPFNTTNLKIVKELQHGAENFLAASVEHLKSRDIHTKVLEGETAKAILEYCLEYNIDLLVIGTHSHSALENVLMGNVAVKIVRHAKIPILIVPTQKT